jgi:hypothetical protein
MWKAQAAMAEVISLSERMRHPGQQGLDKTGLEYEINARLRDVWVESAQHRPPAVCHLGFYDGWQKLRRGWELKRPAAGQKCNLPQSREMPVERITTPTSEYAIMRADPDNNTGPFRIAEYTQDGQREKGSILLPPQLPRDIYGVTKPFTICDMTCDALRVAQYQHGNMAVELMTDTGEPIAKLSVNLPDTGDPLRPGHFWVPTWFDHAPVAQAAVDNGLLLLSGTWTPTGGYDGVAVEGCLNYGKLGPILPSTKEPDDGDDTAQGSE